MRSALSGIYPFNFLLLLAAATLSSCSNGGGGGDNLNIPNQIQVPQVVGLDETAAMNNLSNLDLDVMVVRESRNAPINEVVEQNPLAGQFVDEGSTVTITVSEGISVPSLVGMPETDVIQSLTDLNLNYSVSYENNNALSGQVLSQSVADSRCSGYEC